MVGNKEALDHTTVWRWIVDSNRLYLSKEAFKRLVASGEASRMSI